MQGEAEAARSGIVIALADGGDLRVTGEVVYIGHSQLPLARILDARQVSPNPETVALRVAGMPLVEFRPLQAGEGRLVLEAIYRFRPDLRPLGFEVPNSLPAGFPTLPIQPPLPTLIPGQYQNYASGAYTNQSYPPLGISQQQPPRYPGYAQPGFPPPQGSYMRVPGSISPNRSTGELTPYPRRFGEVLSAMFQLFGKNMPSWLMLGLLVGIPAGVISGAIQLTISNMLPRIADSAFSGDSVACQFPAVAPVSADQVLHGSIILVGLLAVVALLNGLAVATLGDAAQRTLLGGRGFTSRHV